LFNISTKELCYLLKTLQDHLNTQFYVLG
jgi:hypothetical protein